MARENKSEVAVKSHRDRMVQSSNATIKINNVEILVSEYMKDPAKYNKQPIAESYLKEVETHFDKSMEDNARLQFDRGSLKTLL